jgi:hypothetical protein
MSLMSSMLSAQKPLLSCLMLAGEDYDHLHQVRQDCLYFIRMKTGPSNTGRWPNDPMGYQEWPGERSPADALDWCRDNGVPACLILGNEPDIELATDADDAYARTDAMKNYLQYAERAIADLNKYWPNRFQVAAAPISQGNPERFEAWLNGVIIPLAPDTTAIAEHCYTNGLPHDDLDWGGRWNRFVGWGKTLYVTEVNDNGAFAPGTPERVDDLTRELQEMQDGGVAAACLFTLPGGDDAGKPYWWWLGQGELLAVRGNFEPGILA